MTTTYPPPSASVGDVGGRFLAAEAPEAAKSRRRRERERRRRGGGERRCRCHAAIVFEEKKSFRDFLYFTCCPVLESSLLFRKSESHERCETLG